jgi:hypothetical protein
MAVMSVLLMERIMKWAAEMGSGSMIYLPSFMKIGTGIEGIFKVLPQ